MSDDRFSWWSNLRHGGLLLDTPRLTSLIPADPSDLAVYDQERLRRRLSQFLDDPTAHRGEMVSFVLESICGFSRSIGAWHRGAEVRRCGRVRPLRASRFVLVNCGWAEAEPRSRSLSTIKIALALAKDVASSAMCWAGCAWARNNWPSSPMGSSGGWCLPGSITKPTASGTSTAGLPGARPRLSSTAFDRSSHPSSGRRPGRATHARCWRRSTTAEKGRPISLKSWVNVFARRLSCSSRPTRRRSKCISTTCASGYLPRGRSHDHAAGGGPVRRKPRRSPGSR